MDARKARNEAPGRLKGRDEFDRLSGFDEFQISSVERTAAPTAYAGRNDEPQIVRQGHTPANEMLCRQHEPGRDDRFPRLPFPAVRPAAANDNCAHWCGLRVSTSMRAITNPAVKNEKARAGKIGLSVR
jgi:hypothetical protein